MPDLLFGPTPHDEAADFIQSKPVVSREVFAGLLPELKARAFVITGVEGANVVQAVRDRIADLPAGANWDDVKKDVVDDISPFLVDPNADPEERDGQVKGATRRAELLLRTHGFQAYQAAQYNVMDRQRDVLPYWQYLTMEDEKVRPEHAALDQIVLPASSPFWNSHYPPWDYGCRCQVVPISQDDRDELDEKDKKRAPDNQLVLEGSQAQRLEQGQLVRPGRSFDVRSPREKEGGSGYGWHPGDLRLSIDQLRGRYDTATFSAFSSWARTTPLEQGGARTVWDWLGGQSAGPVTPPRLDLASVIGAHVAHPGTMTPTEAARVVDALRQSHDVMAAAKTTIHVDPALSRGWKDYVSYEVSNFFSLLPKSLLDTLPKFDVQVVENHPEGILGSYDRANRVLVLNAKTLDGNASLIQETIFHELMHWVHRHGPAWYQQGIEQHFLDRTKGEATTQLPGYGSGTIGRKDKWWDSYMGRMYGGKTDGAEIPTMAAELLASPAKFALLWNEPLHRATIQEALSILFPRP